MVHSNSYWGRPVAEAWSLLRRDLGKGQVLVQFVKRPYKSKEAIANLNSYVYGGITSNEDALDELYILTLPSFQWTLVCILAPQSKAPIPD